MEEKLKMLSCVSNRSLNQTRELFFMCDESFDKLLKLEAVIKRTFYSGCPGDIEEVDRLVGLWGLDKRGPQCATDIQGVIHS